MKGLSRDEALQFAIAREEEAHQFYTQMAEGAGHSHMRETFLQFAKEELGHKAKIEGWRKGAPVMKLQRSLPDMKLADYLVETQENALDDYQAALIVAMKREKAAFKLYSALAASAEDDDLKRLFEALAQEEARHKLRFEVEYDDYYLKEN